MGYKAYLIKQSFISAGIGAGAALLFEKEKDDQKSKLKLLLKGATYGMSGSLVGMILGGVGGGLAGGLGGAGWGILRKMKGLGKGTKIKINPLKHYREYIPSGISKPRIVKVPGEPWISSIGGSAVGTGAGVVGGSLIGSALGGRSAAKEEDLLSLARQKIDSKNP